MKKIFQANGNQKKKKAGVAILVLDKTDIKPKMVMRPKNKVIIQ